MLVKHYYHEIGAGGGPTGYLRNLQAAIATAEAPSDVELIVSDEVALGRGMRARWTRLKRRVRTDVLPPIRARLRPNDVLASRFAITIDWLETYYSALTRSDVLRLFECDYAVAHSPLLAERMLELRPTEARRKLLLMTHSPTFLSHEVMRARAPDRPEAGLYDLPFVQALTDRERRVMESVRGVIWPCPEAAEAYAALEPAFDLAATHPVCVMTGVARPAAVATREAMRAAWNIEADQKVVLFLGRGHPHKGFGRFVDWADLCGQKALNEYVFVHGGDAGPTTRDLGNVRRVGYVRDNGAAYAASDLVVIPNVHSYMDIGLLEALSLAAPLAVSPSGGHRALLAQCPRIPSIPDGDAEETWPALRAALDDYGRTGWRPLYEDLWREQYSLAPFLENHRRAMAALA